VVWSSTSYTYTHQKTITVDSKKSYISTGNFDTTHYATSRDFGVFDTSAADVSAVTAVFNADYAHKPVTPQTEPTSSGHPPTRRATCSPLPTGPPGACHSNRKSSATASARAFAGSGNFSSNSLNDNRELGLITTDPAVLSGLQPAFAADFAGGAAA